MVKNSQQNSNKGKLTPLLKNACKTSRAHMILSGERLEASLRWETRQGCPLSSFLFDILLEVPGSSIGPQKRKKRKEERKKEREGKEGK